MTPSPTPTLSLTATLSLTLSPSAATPLFVVCLPSGVAGRWANGFSFAGFALFWGGVVFKHQRLLGALALSAQPCHTPFLSLAARTHAQTKSELACNINICNEVILLPAPSVAPRWAPRKSKQIILPPVLDFWQFAAPTTVTM